MTVTAPRPPQKVAPRRSVFARTIQVLGEIIITIGVVVLLFVVWQLWWTDVMARQSFDANREALKQEWGIEETYQGEKPKPVKPKYGESFGLIYIPALRDRAWGVPIMEGTDRDTLMEGMGHHPGTAVPGEVGNFTLAGHRTTYGAPLHNIEQLKPGDEIIIETKNGWYIYEVEIEEIIKPWDGWVLDPVPGLPAETKPEESIITLYSCHPKYSAAERFVWFGKLVDEYPKSFGTPPAIERYGA